MFSNRAEKIKKLELSIKKLDSKLNSGDYSDQGILKIVKDRRSKVMELSNLKSPTVEVKKIENKIVKDRRSKGIDVTKLKPIPKEVKQEF